MVKEAKAVKEVKEVQNMSDEELRRNLASIDQTREELKRALDQRVHLGRRELAQEIRNMILERGHKVSDVVELIPPKRRNAGRGGAARSYTRYVDPQNPEHVYVRGVLGRWMKEQMLSHGLDPKSKKDREVFKEKYLQKQEG